MNNFRNNMVQILRDAKIDDIPSSLQNLEEQDPVKMAYEELERKIISCPIWVFNFKWLSISYWKFISI